MGAGAVGGYFGARLAAAGNYVAFIARGENLEAIRVGGLKVDSALGDVHVHPATATENPADLGPVDLVLFTPKLWETEAAATAIGPILGVETAVVSLQNGIEAERRLAEILGPSHVLGGVAFISAALVAPGVVRHTGDFARIVFGEMDGTSSRRGQRILEALQSAGIEAALTDDIVRVIWEKFVFLSAFSAITSLVRESIGPIRSVKPTRDLLATLLEEAIAVARAEVVDLPTDYAKDRLAFIDTLPDRMTSSMADDLARGRRLELAWLSGAVVRLGAAHGLDTPAHRFAEAVLSLHAEGRNY